MTQTIPENLLSLHDGEEEVRSRSLRHLVADVDLNRHLVMIERVMDMLQFYRVSYEEADEDHLIVKLLGARLFNAMGGALKLLLGGYYQAAGLQMRDVLETGFLLDYFSHDPGQIQRWKTVSEQDRQKEFNLAKIRTALDERDGFTEKKRHAHYRLLSTMAGHPSFASFEMLRPAPGEDAQMGPFFVPRLLEVTVQELLKVSITAWGNFSWFFQPRTLEQYRAAYGYAKASMDWAKTVYERPVDREHLIALEVIIHKLEEDAAEGRTR